MYSMHGLAGDAGASTPRLPVLSDYDGFQEIRGGGWFRIARNGRKAGETWDWISGEPSPAETGPGIAPGMATASPGRPTGPVQFMLKLLEHWRLDSGQAVGLLGFDRSDADYVRSMLDGRERLRGRDVRDRIACLYGIRKSLRFLFQDLETENAWLREPHRLLDDESPMDLLLGGSMENLLIVRDYVDTLAGR